VLAAILLAGFVIVKLLKRKKIPPAVATPTELPPASESGEEKSLEKGVQSKLAEHDALQQQEEAKAMLKLVPGITKTAELMAKRLRDKVQQGPELSAQVLRTWISRRGGLT
jgi:flagellar biosynthesis/type III secretory pathway M-ring protein FliF/YscJ